MARHFTASPAPPRERNHQLDLLRIVFALLVLVSHAPELTDGNRSREPLTQLVHSAASFGQVAVDGFFLLSGFLIVQSWILNPRLGNYLRKRLLRIVPGYVVAVLLTTLAAGLLAPGVPHFFTQIRLPFLIQMLQLRETATPPVFPGTHIGLVNGSLWTIFYEFHCYLWVAMLGVCGIFHRRWLWVAMTVCVAFVATLPSVHAFVPHHLLFWIFGRGLEMSWLATVFSLGGCFYLYREHIPYRWPLTVVATLGILCTGIWLKQYFEISVVLFGSYLLFALQRMSLPQLGWMRNVPDISYGLYLYGWTVEGLVIFLAHRSPWITFLASSVICVVLGWLSWHLVERPALKLKRKAAAPISPG